MQKLMLEKIRSLLDMHALIFGISEEHSLGINHKNTDTFLLN